MSKELRLFVTLKVNNEKVREILERLDKAREEISRCYYELDRLGGFDLEGSPAKEAEEPED